MTRRFVALGFGLAVGLLVVTWLYLDSPSASAVISVDDVARELVAPCCWTQTVDLHDSQIAGQMKLEIEEMIAKGISKDEIISVYAAKYGERVLSKPPTSGFGLWAYIIPTLSVIVVGGMIYRLAVGWVRQADGTGAHRERSGVLLSAQEENKMRERLQRELDSLQ